MQEMVCCITSFDVTDGNLASNVRRLSNAPSSLHCLKPVGGAWSGFINELEAHDGWEKDNFGKLQCRKMSFTGRRRDPRHDRRCGPETQGSVPEIFKATCA